MNIAKSVKSYYEHEDFKSNYAQYLFETFNNQETQVKERIEKIIKHEYYFEQKYGFNTQLSEVQINAIFDYIKDNFEDFTSDFAGYYVGDTSLESVSYGEQEEQLTGLHNVKTGKNYTMPYLRKVFESEDFYVADCGEYAYYVLSGGLHVDLLNAEIPLLTELAKEFK